MTSTSALKLSRLISTSGIKMSRSTALIIGAGGNIGASTAKLFASKGYNVAVSSRTEKTDAMQGIEPAPSFFPVDLSQPSSVSTLFEKVKEKLGVPNVVIYNASAAMPFNPKDDPLTVPADAFADGLTINATSLFVALQETKKAFESLPTSAKKTFIYTGNALNEKPLPPMLVLGIGKTAAAYLLETCAMDCEGKDWRFYYADERNKEGRPMYKGTTGPAHADLYLKLAEQEERLGWQVTFVDGEGIKEFPKGAFE